MSPATLAVLLPLILTGALAWIIIFAQVTLGIEKPTPEWERYVVLATAFLGMMALAIWCAIRPKEYPRRDFLYDTPEGPGDWRWHSSGR
jgi:hypothetical protein